MVDSEKSGPINVAARADLDIFRRSLPALPAFLLLWIAIAGITEFYKTHQELSLYAAAAVGGVLVFGLLFATISSRLFKSSPLLWRLLFYSCTFASAIVWSGLYTLCFFDDAFEELFLPMTLATASTFSNAAR